MLTIAFKEWASVCEALASGRQSVILRKGGISEESGIFRPDHDRFWLYPTFFHAPQGGLKPDAPITAASPKPGTIRLTHFAEVKSVYWLDTVERALSLDEFHIWDAETVQKRFAYRTQGLYVLTVRVFATNPVEVPERPEYAGCKTWVELDPGAEEHPASPVLDDTAFAQVQDQITRRATK